jgi:hypothetical protein
LVEEQLLFDHVGTRVQYLNEDVQYEDKVGCVGLTVHAYLYIPDQLPQDVTELDIHIQVLHDLLRQKELINLHEALTDETQFESALLRQVRRPRAGIEEHLPILLRIPFVKQLLVVDHLLVLLVLDGLELSHHVD